MKNLKYLEELDNEDDTNLYEEEFNIKQKIRKDKEKRSDYLSNQKKRKDKSFKANKHKSKEFNDD